MTLVTTGLTNGGLTTHYQIQYDDSLSAADGMDRGNALIATCENDFNLMSGWFGGIALTVATPITVNISPGPYASASWGPPITLTPGNGSDIALVRYLLVSEVTEMFMLAQNRGWFGAGNEGSAGEGLSRFLAGQFLIANGLGVTEPGFALANSWMTSPRADYVNNVDVADHGIDAKTGCAILFTYYLHTQLGFSINEIVGAAASELSGVYRNLTGHPGNPFPLFKLLLDRAYPGTTSIPGNNPDNPWTVPWPWGWADLNIAAGGGVAPQAAGITPIIYQTDFVNQGPTARLVYLGPSNHLYEMAYVGNDPNPHWGWADLNIAAGGAPPAAETPIVYQTDFVNQGPTARLVYLGTDNHLYELAYVGNDPNPHWEFFDLNIAAGGGGAATSARTPLAYVTDFVNQGPTARLVYLGPSNHLYELAYLAPVSGIS